MRMRSALVVLALALVACGGGGGDGEALSRVDVIFGPSTQPLLTIHARVAATVDQRAQGLMGRKALRPDAGMLFLFREPVRVGFYMKDTLIPLDIAFIGHGVVLEIRSMVPCKVSKCPVTYPSATYEMALEVGEGTFSKAGVKAGSAVAIQGTLPTPE